MSDKDGVLVRILHIAECYDGGVGHALDTRVAATPEYEHHLLWSGMDDPEVQPGFTSTRPLPTGTAARMRAVRRAVRSLRPDIVHAHSSWAGVYARAQELSAPVVYEPHCFKFDDPSLGPTVAMALRNAERLLAIHTKAFGTLSGHEDALARSLSKHARTVRIPNVPSVPPIQEAPDPCSSAHKVVMIGRIAPQKDPSFFARVARCLRSTSPDLEPVWVGDGDELGRSCLIEAGVRVTGWLPPEGIVSELLNSVYVHSAKYEGFPLSILDAAACRIPIIARRIPPLADTNIMQANTPEEIAGLARLISIPGEERLKALRTSASLLTVHNTDGLHDALCLLYQTALR